MKDWNIENPLLTGDWQKVKEQQAYHRFFGAQKREESIRDLMERAVAKTATKDPDPETETYRVACHLAATMLVEILSNPAVLAMVVADESGAFVATLQKNIIATAIEVAVTLRTKLVERTSIEKGYPWSGTSANRRRVLCARPFTIAHRTRTVRTTVRLPAI